MIPLMAEIQTRSQDADARIAPRRTLCLEVPTMSPRDQSNAVIHNLSQTGLLIQTSAELGVGEPIEIDLPEAGPTLAKVIWTRGEFVGCEFEARVSKGAVAAALLRAPAELQELPVSAAMPIPAAYAAAMPAAYSADEWLLQPAAGDPRALWASLTVSLMVALTMAAALLAFPFAA